MRLIQKTVAAYEFHELTGDGKAAVLSWYAGTLDSYWFESVYDDYKTVAGFLGLRDVQPRFTGFWSQGDGASFTASYSYKPGGLSELIKYAPQDSELHAIGRAIVAIQRRAFYRIDGQVTTWGRYSHEYTMRFENDDLLECFRRLARWLYAALESAYEYETSAENVAAACEANEWEFDARGVLIK